MKTTSKKKTTKGAKSAKKQSKVAALKAVTAAKLKPEAKAKQPKLLEVAATPKRKGAGARTEDKTPARKNGVQSAAGTGTPRTILYADLEPGHNARETFDPVKIEELAEQIRTQGLKQRLIVYPDPARGRGKWLIHGGHRRYLAIGILISRGQWAGGVPCEEQADVAESDRQAVGLIENLGRVDLNPVEKAKGCRDAIATGGWVAWDEENKGRSLGHLLGYKSKSTMYALLNLATLCPVAEAALALWPNEGSLSPAVADKLARIRDPKRQDEAAQRAIREKWTDKVAAQEVERYQRQLKGAPFDTKDATLVPRDKAEGWGGPCATCALRSGNQVEMFGEFGGPTGRGDMCLRPSCFEAKQLATWDREALEHQSKGGLVLSPEEAEKIGLKKHGSWLDCEEHLDLDDDAEYTDANGDPLGSIGDLCADAIASGALPVTLARANNGSGKVYRIVDANAAEAIMQALPEVKAGMNEGARETPPLCPADWQVGQERERRVDRKTWELLKEALPNVVPAVDVLRLAVAAFSNSFEFAKLLEIPQGPEREALLVERINTASMQELWEWFLFLVALGNGRTFDVLCASQEIDGEGLEKHADESVPSREAIAQEMNAAREKEAQA